MPMWVLTTYYMVSLLRTMPLNKFHSSQKLSAVLKLRLGVDETLYATYLQTAH